MFFKYVGSQNVLYLKDLSTAANVLVCAKSKSFGFCFGQPKTNVLAP